MTWNFADPLTGESYDLEIGPLTVTLPRVRNVAYSVNDVNGAIALIGPNHRPLLTLEGTLLSAEQLLAFDSWFDRNRIVVITDQLGQQYVTMLASLTRSRQRSGQFFFRHTWNITAYVFDYHLLPNPVLVPQTVLVPG